MVSCTVLHNVHRDEECDQLWNTQCGPYTLLVLSATVHTSTCGCINTYIYIHTHIHTYVRMYIYDSLEHETTMFMFRVNQSQS